MLISLVITVAAAVFLALITQPHLSFNAAKASVCSCLQATVFPCIPLLEDSDEQQLVVGPQRLFVVWQ